MRVALDEAVDERQRGGHPLGERLVARRVAFNGLTHTTRCATR